MLKGTADTASPHDELWNEAVALIAQHRTASTSFLQRKLRIGYSRAARLLDELEAAGHVGPSQGSAGRTVHIVEGDGAEDARPTAADADPPEDDDGGWRIG